MTDPRDDTVARTITEPDHRPVTGVGPPADRRPDEVGPLDRLRDRVNGLSLRDRLVGILVIALLAALGATGYGVQAVLSRYLVGQIDTE